MIPIRALYCGSGITLRTGCSTRPAEKSMSARSIAGIRSSNRKTPRMAASSKKGRADSGLGDSFTEVQLYQALLTWKPLTREQVSARAPTPSEDYGGKNEKKSRRRKTAANFSPGAVRGAFAGGLVAAAMHIHDARLGLVGRHQAVICDRHPGITRFGERVHGKLLEVPRVHQVL